MASTRAFTLVALALCFAALSVAQEGTMPAPFYRELYVTSPMMSGDDVIILQNLIARSTYVSDVPTSGSYDNATATAVSQFQAGNSIADVTPGVFDSATANLLLELHSCDGYIDDGTPAGELGYLYKIRIQVFRNRSYETKGQLYDAENNLRYEFRVRAHGHDFYDTSPTWPSFTSTDGLNMFTSDGNTPTGLVECDLNSPEGDALQYGPFPITRLVKGLEGNAEFLLPSNNALRTGILMHTGVWYEAGWTPEENMPNSSGCLHSHPVQIKDIWQILTDDLGVEVRENPGGAQPYPYTPQGLFSIEQVGCQ